jgi:hypothetical protein
MRRLDAGLHAAFGMAFVLSSIGGSADITLRWDANQPSG